METSKIAWCVSAVVVAAVIGGCDLTTKKKSSDNAGTSQVSDPSPNPPLPDLTKANPPYTVAATSDLALWFSHIHQDYFWAPTQLHFYFSVHSTYTRDIANVQYMIRRLDGPPQDPLVGVIPMVKAGTIGGDGHDYEKDWIEQNPGGRHYYELLLDPFNQITDDADLTNNRYVFVVDVPDQKLGSHANDIEFYGPEAHVHCDMPNSQFDAHFEVRNLFTTPVTNLQWRLQVPDIAFDQTFTIPSIPGDPQDPTIQPPPNVDRDSSLQQIFKLMQPGLHDVILTLDPNNQIAESNETNNVRVFHILVGPPAGNG
jgi:hypothetical protein